MLVHDDINKNLPKALQNIFKTLKEEHNHRTRGSSCHKMKVPAIKKVHYGEYSIEFQAVKFWNTIVSKYPEQKLQEKSRVYTKEFITRKILETYKKIELYDTKNCEKEISR